MNIQQLAAIRAGEVFTLRGYTYRAEADAERWDNGTVYIKAVRQNDAMPSGWELADVMEWR